MAISLMRAVAVAAIMGAAIARPSGAAAADPEPGWSISSRGAVVQAPETPSDDRGRNSYRGGGKISRNRKDAAGRTDDRLPPDLKPALDTPRSVIGLDSRVRELSTTAFPNRAVGWITFQRNGFGSMCTGWLANKNTVITAGHCVHGGGTGGDWSANVKFYPGASGPGRYPYGSCGARALYSVVGWVEDDKPDYDYGAIKLDCNIGNSVGWLGFWWQSASLDGVSATVRGYPGDKPSVTQWFMVDRVRESDGERIWYAADTYGGQSGSPVYSNGSRWCRGVCVFAIHGYGVGLGGFEYNSGARITRDVFDNIIYWRKQ